MSKKIPIIYNSLHLDHRPCRLFGVDPHPDQADRIENIILEIKKADIGKIIKPTKVDQKILYQIHHPDYIKFLKSIKKYVVDSQVFPEDFPRDIIRKSKNFKSLLGQYSLDICTPVSKDTYKLAINSASIAYTGAKLLKNGEQIVYSACRPPGHHAMKNFMDGFCYLNNTAVAAQYLSQFGKVTILDLDYHHGNGTQDIFYDRSDVLTISIHADPNVCFPYHWGFKDKNKFNINYPLSFSTDEKKYDKTLIKALKEIKKFSPKYIIVAFGLDTYEFDNLGKFKLSTPYYKTMAAKIKSLKLPVLVVQEGGYHKEIGKNVVSFLNGFIA
jgi:acetoin utilization deacetylase AcuC-like enzyme